MCILKEVTGRVSVSADSKGLICTKIVQKLAVRGRTDSKGVSKRAVSTDVPAWRGVNLKPKEGSGETSRGVNGFSRDDHGPS